MMLVPTQDQQFGPHKICKSEIFAGTKLSFAFVNLKPVVPGMHPHASIVSDKLDVHLVIVVIICTLCEHGAAQSNHISKMDF